MPPARPVVDALQVHSSYIVTEDEAGLVIIDQHALHERVMFEKLKRAHRARDRSKSQRLLMPAAVDVDEAQAGRARTSCSRCSSGSASRRSRSGPRRVAVHAFTSLLFERRRRSRRRSCSELLGAGRGASASTDDPEAALHEVLDMMACKAAIKAGDRLTPQEIAELLARRERVERSSNCPHGRPTTLRLTLAELERQFGR